MSTKFNRMLHIIEETFATTGDIIQEYTQLPDGWDEEYVRGISHQAAEGKIPIPKEITNQLDFLAYGYERGEILHLDPDDIEIIWKDDLANPEYLYELRGMEWVNSVSFEEPVELIIGRNGRIQLDDGHHRLFASRKLGRKVKGRIEDFKGNPLVKVVDDGIHPRAKRIMGLN